MNIRNIWKNTNISSLLLLKLFDKICENCMSVQNSSMRVPIHFMCYDYGLLDCYLDGNNLALVFDKQTALSDLRKTTSNYYCFLDRLTDSPYYHSTISKDNLVVIFLTIPGRFKKDIELIKQSKYSETSKMFKKEMLMNYSRINGTIEVPEINHPIAKYIVTKNIPAKIVLKNEKLTAELLKIFGELTGDTIETMKANESYTQWDSNKETWHESKLDKYV